MTHEMTQAAQQLLVPPLLWFFFIAGIFSIAVGIGLICFSSRTFVLFETLNRWVSFRRALKPAAIQRDSWPFVERHRRWFALVFIVASLFSIFNLIAHVDVHQVSRLLGSSLKAPPLFVEWIVDSIWWFLLLGSVLTVAVGVALGFFPQAMHKLEQQSAHWYSSRHVSKSVDVMHTPLDKLVLQYPRTLGGVIVVAALVNVVMVARYLF